MSSLKRKLRRNEFVTDSVLDFIEVRTWLQKDRWYVTVVIVDGKRQVKRMSNGATRAARCHGECIEAAYRLYGGVWSPVKYQEKEVE